jgi:hypothetical protein
MLYRRPTQHIATTYGLLKIVVMSTSLYAAGHTRMHRQSTPVPNLTLVIVQMNVTIPDQILAFAQTSHLLETAMCNQPTVIYTIILERATQTLHMTVGGSRSVMIVAPSLWRRLGRDLLDTVNKRKRKVVEVRYELTAPLCFCVLS